MPPPALRAFVLLLVVLAAFVPRAVSAPPALKKNFTVPEAAIAMLWVSPGTFFMRNPHGAGDDTEVTLTRGYWLGRTEVTQAQWQAVVRHIPVFDNVPIPSFYKGSEHPVEQVTWGMAAAFGAKLTELERAAGRLPAGYEYRLPTEAEWEYACRAGADGIHAGALDETAWYELNSGKVTHPVARKKPNAWGFFDMLGNVTEWCADWYGPYPGGRVQDPTGPAASAYHTHRGGGAVHAAGACNSGMRWYGVDFLRNRFVGLRLALGPVLPKTAAP